MLDWLPAKVCTISTALSRNESISANVCEITLQQFFKSWLAFGAAKQKDGLSSVKILSHRKNMREDKNKSIRRINII